jgi:hypothetical protein
MGRCGMKKGQAADITSREISERKRGMVNQAGDPENKFKPEVSAQPFPVFEFGLYYRANSAAAFLRLSHGPSIEAVEWAIGLFRPVP